MPTDERARAMARMLHDLNDAANRTARRFRERQHHEGHPIETRADYAEGAAAAYAVASSVLAGAFGEPSFDRLLLGEGIDPFIARPIVTALREQASALAIAAKLDVVSLVPLAELRAGDHYAMPLDDAREIRDTFGVPVNDA